jgi:hypothetical protein
MQTSLEEKCYLRGVRIAVVTVHESWSDTKPTYRLCEADGTTCNCWLPGIEPPDPEGALDRGGFDQRLDAAAFALGVDYERALFGLIAETVEAIDIERHALDSYHRATLDKVAANAVKRIDERPEPVVRRRRRRVA